MKDRRDFLQTLGAVVISPFLPISFKPREPSIIEWKWKSMEKWHSEGKEYVKQLRIDTTEFIKELKRRNVLAWEQSHPAVLIDKTLRQFDYQMDFQGKHPCYCEVTKTTNLFNSQVCRLVC
jgi:hypothetical protein